MSDRVVRVCVTGVESSGKSTLARALAERLDTVVVPELVRAHNTVKLARGDKSWSEAELLDVIERQRRLEDELAERARGGVLVCDTDALTIAVWHERSLGHHSDAIEAAATERCADFYLLAGDEIPFVPDDIRDHAFGAFRPLSHLRFVQALEACSNPWLLVRGTNEERLETALTFLASHGVNVGNAHRANSAR